MYLVDFGPFHTRETALLPVCFDAHQVPSEKGVYSKTERICSRGGGWGGEFFSFRVDSFSEGRQINFERVVYAERVSIH